jgi:hypothetical protein
MDNTTRKKLKQEMTTGCHKIPIKPDMTTQTIPTGTEWEELRRTPIAQ